MTPSAAKEIKEASDSKFFSDQFVSLKHITHSGIRETEAGYWNYFQSKQEFSKIEKKWCLPFLRELFCKSKWNSKRGGSGACVSLLFSVGSIQAVVLKNQNTFL